jgi:glycolate oxidase iron-sulfur subunit
METAIKGEFAKTLSGMKADSIIRSCVHCGFCLASCPTYSILNNELDSPRGRIYLIKSALEDNNFSKSSIKHLDQCLTCRACETICPSGVQYSQLADIGREFLEHKRPFWQKIYRNSVRKFITNPILFNAIGWMFRQSKTKVNSVLKLEKKNGKVLLLEGCVQPSLAPNINNNIKNILTKLGYEVITSKQSQCCGAIDQHLSANKQALVKIKNNINNWIKLDVDVIISSASGCGLMVKDYRLMFAENDKYYQKSKEISSKTIDIAEFLADKDLSLFKKQDVKISYQEPCTLQHGQNIAGLTHKILQKIGYQLTVIDDNHICCGSAGTYSIFQPKLAKKLRDNKLNNLQKNQPEIIVTSNIGCLMHLQKGTKTPVKHWTELLS